LKAHTDLSTGTVLGNLLYIPDRIKNCYTPFPLKE